MAKKQVIPTVDIATVEAERGAGDTDIIVDVDNIPTPASREEMAVHIGVAEGDASIDPTDVAGINNMLGKSAAAMAASEAHDTSLTPDDGMFIKVFYHIASRQYVQFNQALVGRRDFQLRKVKKSDFTKLGVAA